ncbi:MAG TPA: DUF1015 domain-containing protein [bacterium]|nr:DUF1015 domain-containing protein [bacterium]
MVEIKPFKGYIYNLDKIGEMSKVISPPWDLINEELEKKLLSLSEFNIVKLISKENNPDDVYETLNNWIENKILIQDDRENFYFLKENFEYDGKNYERKGIFGILKIEDFEKRNIIPHERIFQKYSDNRYKILEKCKSNFCPVFMLYPDKCFQIENIIDEEKNYFTGYINNEKFSFGRIESREKIMKIEEIFKEKVVFIADGHHRYNASLMFYKNNPEERNKYLLVYLANIESDGVIILPTHRYIPSEVNLNFDKNFVDILKVNDKEEMEKLLGTSKERKIGMFYNGFFYILKIKNYEKQFKEEGPYLKLDTFLVDNFLIKNFVDIKENVEFLYHSSKEYLLNEYKKRKNGVIFFLNPVKKDIFIEMCLNGKLMPQKSTYFFPKVPSGLVIYVFPDT